MWDASWPSDEELGAGEWTGRWGHGAPSPSISGADTGISPAEEPETLPFFLLCLPHLYRKCSSCHCSDLTSEAELMAEGSACFDWDVAASAAGNHYASSGHGGVAQHFVHNDGGAPAGVVVVPDAGSRVPGGIGEMDPTSFPGYGNNDAPTAIAAPAQAPPRAGSSGQGLTQFKGSWTVEEDTLLRAKVQEFGNGRWAKVALYLPGRSGKQCRERWINQLDPNIEVISRDLNFLTP